MPDTLSILSMIAAGDLVVVPGPADHWLVGIDAGNGVTLYRLPDPPAVAVSP